jgi:hypothetical protein
MTTAKTPRLTKAAQAAQLRAAQLAAVLDALADAALAGKPGVTAHALAVHVPVYQPTPAETKATGVLACSAPLTLVLKLLAELQQAGQVRQDPAPGGARWHLTGPAVRVLPCFGVDGPVVMVGSGHGEEWGTSPGWCVRYLDADGGPEPQGRFGLRGHTDVFVTKVIADQAAAAIRAGTYDWPAFHGRDLALAEGVMA